MSRGTSFGEILRDARIRRGMDLSTVARKLRVRADILAAIEESDFSRMPARGHAKSMIAAYARLVGVNPGEMTRRYLDEVYAFEVGRVRSRSSASARETARGAAYDPSRQRTSGRGSSARNREARESMRGEAPQARALRGESMREGDRSYRSGSARDRVSDRPLRTAGQGRVYEQSRVHSSRGAKLPTASTHYTNLVAAPKGIRGASGTSGKTFLVAGVILLLVLVLVLMLVFGGKDEKTSEQLPSVPVSGLTDTSTPTASEDNSVPTAPTSAVFAYKVAAGSSAYIEVYVDGAERPSEAATVEGEATNRYEVTGTLKFVTTNPEAVTLTVDGASVEPEDGKGSGVYTYTVDFATILANWQAENAAAIEAANAAKNAAGTDENTGGASGSAANS